VSPSPPPPDSFSGTLDLEPSVGAMFPAHKIFFSISYHAQIKFKIEYLTTDYATKNSLNNPDKIPNIFYH
jgi:hypothetical protein